MGDCVNCGRELQPEWKFCIYCGTALLPRRPEVQIPSAIRPEPSSGTGIDALNEPDDEDLDLPRRKKRIDIPLTIGIALGVAGIALVVYMAIVLTGG